MNKKSTKKNSKQIININNIKEFIQKNIKLIAIILIVLLIILFVIIFLVKNDSGNEGDNPISLESDEMDFNMNQADIVIEEKVTISEFRIHYYEPNQRWYLDVKVKNGLSKEINLENYYINIYDKNNKIIRSISKGIMGKIPANDTYFVVIESIESLKNADHIDIMKK